MCTPLHLSTNDVSPLSGLCAGSFEVFGRLRENIIIDSRERLVPEIF
jgi:hypothetical protein